MQARDIENRCIAKSIHNLTRFVTAGVMKKKVLPCILDFFSLLFLVTCIKAYSHGDRVSTLCQTHHGGFKSPWMDLNLHQMPKFGWPESFIIQVNLPRPAEDAAEMRLDPSEDVKISLTFSKHKLVVPWTLLYDSKHKKSLLKLIVTFAHDDFDVISLKSESIYGPPIARLEPQHPSLTAFEVVYDWEAVHDNDLRVGIISMFFVTLLILCSLTCFIVCTYDRDLPTAPPSLKSDRRSGINNTSREIPGDGHLFHHN